MGVSCEKPACPYACHGDSCAKREHVSVKIWGGELASSACIGAQKTAMEMVSA